MAHDHPDPLAWALDAFRDRARADRYRRYGRYYRGDHDLAFATDKFRTTFGSLFATFAYNRCSVVVDSMADRLSVESFTAAAGDVIGQRAGELWSENQMNLRAGEVHKEVIRSGDAYVIVWPEMQEDGTILPTIWPQKAAEIRVHYDDERPGQLTTAAKSWELHDKRLRLNLYFPDRIEKYVTRTKAIGGLPTQSAGFEPFIATDPMTGRDEPWPIRNPYNAVPVLHFANNADTGEYGQSELRDVLPLQDGLNKTLMDEMVTMELAAFPQRVILGIEPSTEDETIDSLRKLEGGVAKIITISGEAAKIAEFSAAQLSQFIDVAEAWDVMISRASRLPVHLLKMSGDFPSGVAMRTAEHPFTSKIEDRQVAFGQTWAAVMRLALRMVGIAAPGQIETVWTSAAPISEEETWDLAVTKKAAGLPLARILEEAGYDPDEIGAIEDAKRASAQAFAQTAVRAFDAGELALE